MLHLQFDPFPVLSTERLELRALNENDIPALFRIRSNEEVNTYINRPLTTDLEQVITFLERIRQNIVTHEAIMWAICYKQSTDLLGTICLWNINKEQRSVELGYELHPDHQGKGIMQEAMAAVIAYGIRTMNAEKIEAYTHVHNDRSRALLTKYHFRRDHEAERSLDDQNEMIWFLRP